MGHPQSTAAGLKQSQGGVGLAPLDCASGRLGNRRQHPHQDGFARPARAEQANDIRTQFQVEVIQSPEIAAVLFGELRDGQLDWFYFSSEENCWETNLPQGVICFIPFSNMGGSHSSSYQQATQLILRWVR